MEALTALDFQILDAISKIHCDFLDILMPLITKLGDDGIVPIAVALILTCIPKTRKAGVTIMVSLALGFIVCNLTLKPLVARIRPYDVNTAVQILVDRLHDFSFPSAHTTALFALAVPLGHYYPRGRIWFYLAAIAVAFSRLYLYVHYPSDVLAGMIFGILFGVVAVLLVKWAAKRFPTLFQPKKGT